jgi:glucosamine-6-phosphate deaminase
MNGHLGFNEPPSDPSSPTRVVELSAASIAANARYWDDEEVPPRAVTLGMRAILSSRTIVLVVAGPSKRAIVHRVLEGSVGPEVPGTFLREAAAEVTVIVDRDAWGDG